MVDINNSGSRLHRTTHPHNPPASHCILLLPNAHTSTSNHMLPPLHLCPASSARSMHLGFMHCLSVGEMTLFDASHSLVRLTNALMHRKTAHVSTLRDILTTSLNLIGGITNYVDRLSTTIPHLDVFIRFPPPGLLSLLPRTNCLAFLILPSEGPPHCPKCDG